MPAPTLRTKAHTEVQQENLMLMRGSFDLEFDWRAARRQTTACESIVHFNNAGAALMPNCVVDAAIDHLRYEARCGGYEAEDLAREKIQHVYSAAEKLLGCRPGELAIVENASRAWSIVFYSVSFQPGDVVLTSQVEYANNFMAMLHAEKTRGIRIVVVESSEFGEISLEGLQSEIDRFGQKIRVVSLAHVPTNSGLVNPARQVGQLIASARRGGQLRPDALFMVDACQSAGQVEIDVDDIGCDVLTTCSRKYLRGPRGLGLLYVRSGILDPVVDGPPVLLDVRAAEWIGRREYKIYPDARRFETWETNNAGKIALGTAIDLALDLGVGKIEQYVGKLAARLRDRLTGLSGVRVHDRGAKRCGIVSFTVDGQSPIDIKKSLSKHNINVSVSERALTRLDMEDRNLDSIVRASVHYYNSESEIEYFVEKLDECRFDLR
jgi:selenocysteine lyase/cysteine desulfurase